MMSTEEMSWIYSQIFKEISSEIKEEDERETIKNYCSDLDMKENTFDLIGTRRQLIEDYESLREMTRDSNSFVSLGNLMLEKKDYDRTEYFYLKGLHLDNDDWLGQIKILNKLSQLLIKTNQIDKAKEYSEQANTIQQQHRPENQNA